MADDFQFVDDEEQKQREKIIDLIKMIRDVEAVATPLNRNADQMKAQVKQWMLLNLDRLDRDEAGKPLAWNPELSAGYVLTEIMAREADIVSMANANPAQLLDMATAGALRADWKVVDAHPGAIWKEDLKRFTMNTASTTRMDKKG